MDAEDIAEIGITDDRLYVRPTRERFEFIYRAAMGVGWDNERMALIAPRPGEWSQLRWFRQIKAAAADEYRVQLRVTPTTRWVNVPAELRSEIENDL